MQPNLILEHQLLAVETEHDVHVMLELTAPPRPEESQRPPLHLALVLDRSGSMHGPKLEVTKQAAAFLVQRLSPEDSVAVVAFDHDVDLVAPLAAPSADVAAAIRRLHSGGSTNLSGGWLEGIAQLGAGTGGQRRVLLLTDGQANQGITDDGRLVAMAREAYERGIGTATIGFGRDFAEDLLTAMADAGGAGAHYAETADDVPAIFDDEFEGLVHLAAQNVTVEIRPTPDVAVLGVLNDYPSQPIPGGVRVSLGDAYADAVRRLVLRLHVPALQALGAATVAEITLRWAEPTEAGAKLHTVTMPLQVNLVSADEAAAAEPDARVRHEVLLLEAARALDEAKGDADGGDVAAAAARLASTADLLLDAAPASPMASELLEQAEEMRNFAGSLASDGYGAAERKRMHYASHSSRRGRRPRRPQ